MVALYRSMLKTLMHPCRTLRGGKGKPATAAESNGEAAGKAAAAGDGDASENKALVLSGPERKHHKVSESASGGVEGCALPAPPLKSSLALIRYMMQVYVVELTRKPLFPGIYTPVTISKNEKLIKEITEAKKQGCVQDCLQRILSLWSLGVTFLRHEMMMSVHHASSDPKPMLEPS